ncbi:MAG: hypothetical protein LBL63_03180, partial [Clostridiales Family XIII bacterium]|nr:hypothetical protein [Clostridiales Family XIII bacterium]
GRPIGSLIAAAALAAVSLATVLATQEWGGVAVLFDGWSAPGAILLAAECVLVHVGLKRKVRPEAL